MKSNIPALRRGLQGALRDGVGRAALYVHDVARQLVPVDTSALQRTIHVEGPEEAGESVQYTVLAGDASATRPDGRSVDYVAHVEFGSANSAAQPFMTPAARAIRPAQEVKAEVKDLIRRVRL